MASLGTPGSMTSMAGQLDEVSLMLGKMEGVVESLNKYVHDWKHDENNRRMADQNFQRTVLGHLEKMRADMKQMRDEDSAAIAAIRLADRQEFEILRNDVNLLQANQHRRDGMLGLVDWIFHSPLVGWIAAAAFVIYTWFKGIKAP